MPVRGWATPEGTATYAQRFQGRAADGHFRRCQGLTLSSIGLGTYLGEPDAATDAAYAASVERAVTLGCNVLDTAINYRFQRSERSIGAALKKIAREEVLVCTKAGFLTPDGEMPADPRAYFQREYLDRGVLQREEICGGMHCIAPQFLADQIARSLRNMDLETIDVFYVHNPETQPPEVGQEEFHRRLRRAFEMLEGKAADGQIRYYGTATWNGYHRPPQARDHLGLEAIAGLAREVGGDGHHFRFLQLPHNLQMPEAFTARLQPHNGGATTLLKAAADLGITVIASASLMQAGLAEGLPPVIGECLPGLASDAERAIQFVRSTPGLSVALVGMSDVAHVEVNLRLAGVAPASEKQFMGLFERS